MIINPFRFGGAGGGAYLIDGAVFDGTNDNLERGAGLTGAADSKIFTFSFWFNPTNLNSGTIALCSVNAVNAGVDTTCFRIVADSGEWRVFGHNAAGTAILDVKHPTTAANSTWHNLMGSFDLSDVAKRHLYLNGASDLAVTTYTNDTIDFTKADWGVGASPQGGNDYTGSLADFYFTIGEYIDLSVQANREKFRSSAGKPVSLGASGSVPTGNTPIVFLHLDDDETPNNFATNRGAGGGFTLTGSLATSATSPSD